MTKLINSTVNAPKTTNIQGKLYLEPRLFKFAIALENINPNQPLDLRGFTLFRKAIKDRLVTKTQLGSAPSTPKKKQQTALKFTVPREYERRLQIFLTTQAIDDINTLLRQILIEMVNSHVHRAVKDPLSKTTARQAYLDFLSLYDLSYDDFEHETLQQAEYRLRMVRNQYNVHEIKAKTNKKGRVNNERQPSLF